MICKNIANLLAIAGLVSIIRTSVRKRISNRKAVTIMAALGNYRLTNPRRLFRAVAILALAGSFSLAGISVSQAGNGEPAPLEYVTVNQGDSLWSMANTLAQGQDPREWIAEVVLLNALQTSDLTPGQQIALP